MTPTLVVPGVAARRHAAVACTLLVLLLSVAPARARAAEPSVAAMALDRLLAATDADVIALPARATGGYRFVAARDGGVLWRSDAGSAVARATEFLARFGSLVGAERGDLRVADVVPGEGGLTHVRFTQYHGGLRVVNAHLVVHVTREGVRGVNGVFVPGISAVPAPRISSSLAERIAGAATGADHIDGRPSLVVYHSGLAADVPAREILAYEVDARGLRSARVWVDARSGRIAGRESLDHDAKERAVYIGAAVEGAEVRREGSAPSGAQEADDIYDFTGETYDMWRSAFGRDSYDEAGIRMSAVWLAPMLCPNASWNGSTTNFCNGFGTDDVVAHEWGHAYTQFTHELIYTCEPGGLNESTSDIFGELLDLTNGRDGAGGANNEQTAPRGQRWLVGEDLTPAIRDMWSPSRYGQPARASGLSDRCADPHTTSGIPNHAFAILADGKTYNNITVRGLGLTRAAHIYYGAMTRYQHPTTNFAEHALVLRAACDELVGIPLDGLRVDAQAVVPLTSEDCDQVSLATRAVELGLWSGGIIAGRIADEASQPLSRFCVGAFTNGAQASSTISAVDGTYRLTGLQPGSYKIFVKDCKESRYEPRWFGGGTDEAAATPITVQGSEVIGNVDFVTRIPGDPDVAVTGVRFEGTGPGEIVVTLQNFSNAYVDAGRLEIIQCPSTAGQCTQFGERFSIGPNSVTERRISATPAWVGDGTISVTSFVDRDTDESNDSRTARVSIGVDGGGYGVGAGSLFS